MPDPRLNCAAEICCPPPVMVGAEKPANVPADEACEGILLDLGVHPEDVGKVVASMRKRGLVFLSAEMASAIRNIAFPSSGAAE